MSRCPECGAPLICGKLPNEPLGRTRCDRVWRLSLLRFMDGDPRPVTHADLPTDVHAIVDDN
jgi:hypothetical protein